MADVQMDYLDDEERELIESIEGAPHFGERLDPEEENRFRELLKVAARRKPKDTKITLRIASDDLVAIKALARRLGVEYQPLIVEVIHQYTRGQLKRSG